MQMRRDNQMCLSVVLLKYVKTLNFVLHANMYLRACIARLYRCNPDLAYRLKLGYLFFSSEFTRTRNEMRYLIGGVNFFPPYVLARDIKVA